jgi:hypothetical protein
MIEKKIKPILVGIALLIASGMTLLATGQQDEALQLDRQRQMVTPAAPSAFKAAPVRDTTLSKIAGNVNNDYPHATYFCCDGDTIVGPSAGGPIWYAVAFTPTANATVTKIVVPIQYSSGTNEVVLSLNHDASGVPGTVIQSWHLHNLPKFGTCCTLRVVKTTGILVTAGTQYWLVASTDSTGADFSGAWNLNTVDMRYHPIAYYNGTWQAESGVLQTFAILGTP